MAVKTPVSFVDSVWEAFGPLLVPATSVILPPSLMLRPRQLVEALRAHGVTHLASVPSLLALLQPALGAAAAAALGDESSVDAASGPTVQQRLRLKVLVSSGEPLSSALAKALLRALPGSCRLLNLYGSTEVAADCTWHQVTRCDRGATDASPHVPAGKPIGGFRIAILDPDKHVNGSIADNIQQPKTELQLSSPVEATASWGRIVTQSRHNGGVEMRLVPGAEGLEGEVCVAGVGVAAGYLHGEQDSGGGGEEAAEGRQRYVAAAREAQRSRFVNVALTSRVNGQPWGCREGSGPSATLTDEVYFRTGDLGVVLPSGEWYLQQGQ